MEMSSNKPYLIRAIYDWIIDNDLTPYLVVNADYPGIQVPQEYVSSNQIILNISPQSCRGLHLDNDRIVFTTKFAGQNTQIFLIPQAILAIYAKENGKGMEFPLDPDEPPPPKNLKTQTRKPALTLVKKDA